MVASIQAAAPPEVALSVRDLTISLPAGMVRAHAVENISFDLKRGQILCIIGESGSGKSVTANAAMGLLPRVIRVSSGAIHLDGMNIVGMAPDKLRSLRGRVVSMIFQDPLSALNPLMSVGAQNGAQQYLASAPWLAIIPGIATTMAVTSFNFIGDGLRDALDVRDDHI